VIELVIAFDWAIWILELTQFSIESVGCDLCCNFHLGFLSNI